MDNRWGVLMVSLLLAALLPAQALDQLSLHEAYTLLEQRYPALRNGALQTDIQARQQAQLKAENMPGVYLKADGQFQSESVNLDAGNAMLPFEISRPLGSAKTYLEADYLLLDGGFKDARANLIDLQSQLSLQELEVQRFGLREQVNHWFLQAQMLRAQAELYTLSMADLAARQEQVQAGVDYGTVLESELIKIKVRKKELEAQQNDLIYRLQAAVSSLSQLLSVSLDESTELTFPNLPDPHAIPAINRPEQDLFRIQQEVILGQNALIDAERGPKLRLFAQAGVGYPNPLNFLDANAAPYGVIGAGFSWRLLDWDKNELQKQLLSLQAQQVQNVEETFNFNLDNQTTSYLSALDRLEAQIESDEEIAQMQAEILSQMAAQLEGGVITATDYLIQLNAELLARQQIVIHQIQYQQTQLNFWNARGGF